MQPRFSKDPCVERLRELVATELASGRLLDRAYRRLHAKAVAVVLWTLVSYWMLVIVTPWWWPVCLLSFVLAATAVAFNLMHDGNHQAFSRNGRTNRLAGLTLDLLGGSSLFWVDDHNRKHHNAPNVDPFDGDIDYGLIARVAPSQPWRSWYRFQHYYLWFLYSFLPQRWQFYLDLRKVLSRQSANGSAPPKARGQYWFLFTGKLVFLTWAFVLPALLHPLWCVAVVYLAGAGLAGLIFATVLQWAHCVEGARFLSVHHRHERNHPIGGGSEPLSARQERRPEDGQQVIKLIANPIRPPGRVQLPVLLNCLQTLRRRDSAQRQRQETTMGNNNRGQIAT